MNIITSFIYPSVHISENKLIRHFNGKTVVIVGASHGIGEALATRLMSVNCRMILIARTEEKLKNICIKAKQNGCQADYHALDLRDHEALNQLITNMSVELERIDYLFYNAGKSINRNICNATERINDYDRTMSVNYRAMVALSLGLFEKLRTAKGKLIYTSSVSTLYPAAPGWSAYHASKSASNVWCETASVEWRKIGVRTKVAYMPLVRTAMSDANEKYRKMPAYSKEEAAKQLLKLSMNNRYCYKPWWARISSPLSYLLSPIIKQIYKRIA